jgi:hypothetical protein
MTRTQLDRMIRTIDRAHAQLTHVIQELDDYARPDVSAAAVDLAAGTDRLLAALHKLEAERDDLDAIMPPESSLVS